MVIVVVLINVTIALVLLCTAGLLWLLKLRLVKITNWLVCIDHQTQALLEAAPDQIYVGQQHLSHLRHRNHLLTLQIQNLQKILYVILWIQQIWRRFR